MSGLRMDPSSDTRRIDLMMRMDQRLKLVYLVLGALVLVAGLGVGAVGLFFSQSFLSHEYAGFGDLAIKIAGFGTSTFALVPFKQYWAVQERLTILGEMKRAPGLLEQGQENKVLVALFVKRMGAQVNDG
jgi:hypothetical protein